MAKLIFLGTASAIGHPHMFCGCTNCRRARKHGGKDFRSRSSIAIGGKYRIDLNSDAYWQLKQHGIPLHNLEHLLVTHAHLDHIDVNQVMLRFPKYNRPTTFKKLFVYGNQHVMERFHADGYQARRLKDCKIVLRNVEAKNYFRAGEITVWPIPVFHSRRENCLTYVIKYRGKFIYVGYDQKYMTDESFAILSRFKLDIAVFEGTMGTGPEGPTHMTFGEAIALKNRLTEAGALNKRSRCYLTHFSHHVKENHGQLVRLLKPHGIIPAYDGLAVKI